VKNSISVFVGMLLLFSSAAFGQGEGKQHLSTVEDAVSALLQTLPTEEQDYLREMPKEGLIELHFGLGLYIRNSLIRHGGIGDHYNEQLMKSCAKEVKEDAVSIDGCSGIILEALWNRARSNANPTLVRDLDVQLNFLAKMNIINRNYKEKNLGEIIDDINLQVANLLSSNRVGSGMPAELTIAATPSVDLAAHHSSDFIAYHDFLGADSIPLLKLLAWLEERYHLRMKRQPPQIIFDVAPRR
jgi:hypothetical protein